MGRRCTGRYAERPRADVDAQVVDARVDPRVDARVDGAQAIDAQANGEWVIDGRAVGERVIDARVDPWRDHGLTSMHRSSVHGLSVHGQFGEWAIVAQVSPWVDARSVGARWASA